MVWSLACSQGTPNAARVGVLYEHQRSTTRNNVPLEGKMRKSNQISVQSGTWAGVWCRHFPRRQQSLVHRNQSRTTPALRFDESHRSELFIRGGVIVPTSTCTNTITRVADVFSIQHRCQQVMVKLHRQTCYDPTEDKTYGRI